LKIEELQPEVTGLLKMFFRGLIEKNELPEPQTLSVRSLIGGPGCLSNG
jgi:hypothetical protein